MRKLRVLLLVPTLAVVALLVLPWVIGGKLGAAVFCAWLFVLARNAVKMLLTWTKSTLDGQPLPLPLYFVPAPTNPGPDAAMVQFGVLTLIGGVVGAGMLGWALAEQSHLPLVQPFIVSSSFLAGRSTIAVGVGFTYALLILALEARRTTGRPRQLDPWLTLTLTAVVLLIGYWIQGGPR